MTELFIVETDEMVCLMLSFFLHLFLSVFCLLHALPHVSLAFSAILSSSLPAVYIVLPLTCSFTVSHFPSCSPPLTFPVVSCNLFILVNEFIYLLWLYFTKGHRVLKSIPLGAGYNLDKSWAI